MAKSEKIHVMISSRCKAQISYNNQLVSLTVVRKELEKQINSLVLWEDQEPLFECWINETSTSANPARRGGTNQSSGPKKPTS